MQKKIQVFKEQVFISVTRLCVFGYFCCGLIKVWCALRGRYLVALGRSWHPEEFTCSQCKAVLEEGGFFEERGAVYCTKCHDNRYAPNCAKCKKKITGVSGPNLTGNPEMSAKNRRKQSNQRSWFLDRIFFCQEIMHALKMTYHVECFKCAACKAPIRNQAFYMEEGEPYCEKGEEASAPNTKTWKYCSSSLLMCSFWVCVVNHFVGISKKKQNERK